MATSGANDFYLAGVFDGEGCVSMSLAKKGYITVAVKVSMCDREPVVAFVNRFGGMFSDGKQKSKTGRHIYTWTVFNADAVEALEVISQLCLVKNVVANAALPTALNMASNPTRGVLSQIEKEARIVAAKIIAGINKPVGARRILDEDSVESYMLPKKMGGGKAVKLSDGRTFTTEQDAAKALGVSISAISYAKRKSTKTCGLYVESL
jgi:hypothetical protein